VIKRTLHFGNPAYLSLANGQLIVKITEPNNERKVSLAIEDIGVMLLDHQQISITHGAMAALIENNVALIACNANHMPVGMMLPLDGHSLQNERFRAQLAASEPLKKQIWQQTIQTKIRNQAAVLEWQHIKATTMQVWANEVKSGDGEYHEGRAAAWYWPRVFKPLPGFIRGRGGEAPNPWLNYGYAILRAVVARNLVGSGLLATLGVHHANKYNAYCLADDIMEPYRPVVDIMIIQMMAKHDLVTDITTAHKKDLLQIPTMDVFINDQRSPLLVAVQTTTASLAKVFEGKIRKVAYPTLSFPTIESQLPF
jgi:CRISPR-associated protein Cas1